MREEREERWVTTIDCLEILGQMREIKLEKEEEKKSEEQKRGEIYKT